MGIRITVEKGNVEIALVSDEKVVDKVILNDERQLFERLLPEIDKILEKNGLALREIQNLEVVSDQKDTFTTTRIAQAVAKTWNWAVGFDPVAKLDK